MNKRTPMCYCGRQLIRESDGAGQVAWVCESSEQHPTAQGAVWRPTTEPSSKSKMAEAQ
jgi:hypothetical protein